MYDHRDPGPLNSNSIICSTNPSPKASFFQKFCRVKTGEVRWIAIVGKGTK